MAFNLYHRYECRSSSTLAGKYVLGRMFNQLLHMQRHRLVSHDKWEAFDGLQFHFLEHVAHGDAILEVSTYAEQHFGLDQSHARDLYCMVCVNAYHNSDVLY
jgi:hypothetical protein